MNTEITNYNSSLEIADKEICDVLFSEITKHLPEANCKIWHAHPVWFINENPIVGYSKLKDGVDYYFGAVNPLMRKNLQMKGNLKLLKNDILTLNK